MPKPTEADPGPRPCPICGKPIPPPDAGAKRLRPFCSSRCADVDLGRWFVGAYAIPGPPGEVEQEQDDSGDAIR